MAEVIFICMHGTATIEHLASRLRWARGRLHLSQAEAAERFGVTPRTIGSWERGDTLPGSRLHKTLLDFIAEAEAQASAREGAAQAALPPASEATR